MKSIAEVSEIAKVSKTSIYNLIKKHSIPTVKLGGKTYLDEISENLIVGYYSNYPNTVTEEPKELTEDEKNDNYIENLEMLSFLQEQIAVKDNQLESKDRQIDNLLSIIMNQQRLHAADLYIDTQRGYQQPSKGQPKENIFTRLFKRNKVRA